MISEARKRLYNLVHDVAKSHDPIQIARKRNPAVVVSEEDWQAIQETLYLTSLLVCGSPFAMGSGLPGAMRGGA